MDKRFHTIAQVLEDLQQKAQNRQSEKQKQQEESGEESKYKCSICKDTELILFKNEQGYDFGKPCECRDRNSWKRRFKHSMIPDEFTGANFENYQRISPVLESMYQLTFDYMRNFKCMRNDDGSVEKVIPHQNFGLIAIFGEQRLKDLPAAERYETKEKYNNYGIGKTHLQIALAKRLIKDGFNILVVSDVTFMEDLMQAKMLKDDGETYNKMLHGALSADVLVWDDIGKVNWTEPRERMYYHIINERYRMKKPIVFNSNEDRGTLADKIGYAAASRLMGQAEEFLMEAEGQDWRLKKNV